MGQKMSLNLPKAYEIHEIDRETFYKIMTISYLGWIFAPNVDLSSIFILRNNETTNLNSFIL